MGLSKQEIAQRIAQELRDKWYVNLGIGIPTLVANFIPEGLEVEFQSENGLLGMGPFPLEGTEDAENKRLLFLKEGHYLILQQVLR